MCPEVASSLNDWLPGSLLRAPSGRLIAGSSGLVFAIAVIGVAIRVLPWWLDPSIPKEVLTPFIRSLLVLAAEVALMMGIPIGTALAMHRAVERGEARVLLLLGLSPARVLAHVVVVPLAFALVLAGASYSGGRDAQAPGKVLSNLIAKGEATCREVDSPRALAVPLVDATWLCQPAATPRLLLRAPVGGLVVTARSLQLAGDLRSGDLDDVHLTPPGAFVHVGSLRLRGMNPWTRASVVPPIARATLLFAAAIGSAMAGARSLLNGGLRRGAGRVGALSVGASGPLAALLLLRAVERVLPDGSFGVVAGLLLLLVFASGIVAPWLLARALARFVRLPRVRAAATP